MDKPILTYEIKSSRKSFILFLFRNQFFVKIKNKIYNYDLEHLKQLSLINKKLSIPIITGAILLSLSLVAYLNGVISLYLLLFLLLIGIFLLYFGLIGLPSLVITLEKGDENYLLNEEDPYLQKFINVVNSFIKQKGHTEYFIIVSQDEWNKALQLGYLEFSEPRALIVLPIRQAPHILLKINFRDISSKIQYSYAEGNGVVPYLSENVSINLISQVG